MLPAKNSSFAGQELESQPRFRRRLTTITFETRPVTISYYKKPVSIALQSLNAWPISEYLSPTRQLMLRCFWQADLSVVSEWATPVCPSVKAGAPRGLQNEIEDWYNSCPHCRYYVYRVVVNLDSESRFCTQMRQQFSLERSQRKFYFLVLRVNPFSTIVYIQHCSAVAWKLSSAGVRSTVRCNYMFNVGMGLQEGQVLDTFETPRWWVSNVDSMKIKPLITQLSDPFSTLKTNLPALWWLVGDNFQFWKCR